MISRKHGIISFEESKFYYTDNSSNGTYIKFDKFNLETSYKQSDPMCIKLTNNDLYLLIFDNVTYKDYINFKYVIESEPEVFETSKINEIIIDNM